MTPSEPRQRIVRLPGSRRVQLTPVPEAIAEPVEADDAGEGRPPSPASDAGPNDARLRGDVPPHY